jgi:Glycosyltransferase family 87
MAVAITLYRILVFFAKTWTIIAIIVILYSALYLPQAAESTDYVMTFYVAGHLAASGQAANLYPGSDTLSFTNAPFDKATHALLPHLPRNLTAAYMYSPLVAWIFAPLSHLRPNLSLLLWQGFSLAALAICCAPLARLTRTKSTDIFFLSFLLFPVFITVWIGQLGIVFGLLPLCGGYFLLMKNRPFLAGLAWSFLSLKPQYLPAVGLVGLALALVGRSHCLAGIILGSAGLFLANVFIFPTEITMNWLTSLKVSDAIFSSGLYTVPIHLITSLPSNLLMLLPLAQRSWFKWPIYFLTASLWFIGLWECRRLAKAEVNESLTISLTVVVGTILLPLVSPHMLYYDLCIFLPAGATLLGNNWPMQGGILLARLTWITWLSISIYFPLFLGVKPTLALPLLLDFILLALSLSLLKITNKLSPDPKLS